MKLIFKKGQTSQRLALFIQDSSSTVGAGLTGLVFNTGSLVGYYWREDAGNTGGVALTLATATLGTWATGGFKEKDATNLPGWYEFSIPDAALATGAKWVIVELKGASNMAPVVLEIELIDADLFDAVRLGLTALPNAAAEAAGGLYTRGSGAGQINQPANGQVDANAVKLGGTVQTGRDVGASVLLSAGSGAGQLDFTSGVVKANLVQVLATALTETAGQIAGGIKKLFDVASPVMTLLSVNQTGDGFARLGAPAGASHAADVAAVKVDTAAVKVQTDKLAFTVANQVDANVLDWKGSVAPAMTGDAFARLGAPAGASVSADVAAIDTDTSSLVSGVIVTTNNDKTGYALTSGEHTNVTTDTQNGLTAQGYTATRAPYLDTLNGLVQAIWDKASSALTTVGSIGKRLVDDITGDIYTRIGAPAGASVSADVAAVKVDTAAVKVQTDKLAFTVTNQVDANVLDWKSGVAPAMTGDAFARLGAPVGASISADVAGVQSDTDNIQTRLPTALVSGRMDSSVGAIVSGQLVFKKNTAFAAFMFFLVDGTDFVTPRTGVTVTAQRSLDGAAFAGCANAVTEIGTGWYKIDLAAGDLNANNIAFKFSGTGAATRNLQVFTQP